MPSDRTLLQRNRAGLCHEGITPRDSSRWSWAALRYILANRTYLGEIHRRPHVKPGAHPALTDEATWLAAQRPSERLPTRDRVRPSLLRGLLRCAGCGRLMTTARVRVGPRHETRYVCRTFSSSCAVGAHVRNSRVEPYLEALFWQELPKLRRSRGTRRVIDAERQVTRHESDLARYRDNPSVISTLGVERYEQGLAVRVARLERAQLALARARRECGTGAPPDPADLRGRWPQIPLAERRALLQEVFDCVFVGDRGPIEERLHVCQRGTAPDELPRARSLKLTEARAVDVSRLAASPVLSKRARAAWPERRLRAALDPFLHGRTDWPEFTDFQLAGLGLAYRQVEIWGGPERWAIEYGLNYKRRTYRLGDWSEARVRHELAEYLQGVQGWPTAEQFSSDGRWALQRAISRLGGPQRWAAEFGRELRPRQRERVLWTEERIEAALRELSADSGTFPTRHQMSRSGFQGLAAAVGPASARARWAKRLGLKLAPRTMQPATRWSEKAIERAVRPLFEGRRVYPTRNEFRVAGLDPVYQAIYKTEGGHAGWAARYGLVRPEPRRRRV